MRAPFFAANWKMNKTIAEAGTFVSPLIASLDSSASGMGKKFEVVIAPPYTHIDALSKSVLGMNVLVAAQNCGVALSGAFTGEVSPGVLRGLGCRWVILGHSERRHVFKEEETLIQSRFKAAIEADLRVIYCVGETLQDRRAGKTFAVLENHLSLLSKLPPQSLRQTAIAYEPVWAIGTGENATPAQVQEVHAHIREWIERIFSSDDSASTRILYGGSVKPENSQALLAQSDVDGLLVGGASLEPDSFARIIINGLKGKNLR